MECLVSNAEGLRFPNLNFKITSSCSVLDLVSVASNFTQWLVAAGIAAKHSPADQKALSPQTAIIKGTSVKLLTGQLKLQTRSGMTFSIVNFSPFDFR